MDLLRWFTLIGYGLSVLVVLRLMWRFADWRPLISLWLIVAVNGFLYQAMSIIRAGGGLSLGIELYHSWSIIVRNQTIITGIATGVSYLWRDRNEQ